MWQLPEARYWLYQTRAASGNAAGSTTLTQIVEATEGSLSNTVSVVGELDAVQSEDLAFSHLSGLTKLATLKVTAGNTVHKGDVLATVDPAPYQQALDQAKSDLQASQKTLADLQAPPTALALAQADLAIAQAQYDQQKAQSDLADETNPDIDQLKSNVADAQSALAKAQANLVAKQQATANKDELSTLQMAEATPSAEYNRLAAETYSDRIVPRPPARGVQQDDGRAGCAGHLRNPAASGLAERADISARRATEIG